MKEPFQKKILVVAESIDVEDSSGSKANVALILNLRDASYSVLVYHYTRKEIILPGIKCIAIKERKFNFLFLLSRLQRKLQHWFHINLAKKLEPEFGFSFTFLNDSKSIQQALQKLDFNPDLVLTLSKGASFRPHHALLSVPQFHFRWIAYIHDPYPFHYYPEPYDWSEPGYEQKIEFFRQVANKCHRAAFPSLLLKEWMQDRYPAFKEKSLVLPHQMRSASNPSGKIPGFFKSQLFNILHAGNLMKQRPPLFLVKAFQRFLEANPEARDLSRLLLVGSVSYHLEEMEQYAKQIKQLYVTKKNIAYDQVLQMQTLASVNIILESIAPESPFLPGKFPHCIAAERPILLLGPEKSESRRLLGEDYPYWSRLEDVERIAMLLGKLFRLWRLPQEEETQYPGSLKTYLSKEHLRKELDQIIDN